MRELRVECDGVRLFAVEAGQGPVILMLHGGMADHRAALPLVSPLAERYRILAPDLRASGKSWWSGQLTFDRFADDVEQVLNSIGADRAVIGAVSSGTGVALRFALRHPDRVLGLVLVKPIYAGEERGYTREQQQRFAEMDAVASRAADEGVQVSKPLYANLPDGMRERALAMLEDLDGASVSATSHFLVAGSQPFGSASDLARIHTPVLLVRGDDPMHPAEVSDLYAEMLPNCRPLPASTADVAAAIGAFADACAGRAS